MKMKQIFLIIAVLLNISVLNAQESGTTFNHSFYGDFNPSSNDYSNNMVIDTMANVSFYLNQDKTNVIVTSEADTLFNHHILDIEQDGDLRIYHTTNIFNEAVLMFREGEGITLLCNWVDQTETVQMHYKYKYFWSNK